ncbi:MAG: hypothetical protein A2905_05955 [Candidatus Levybacteria bacterium RIFCSPLOWO2_01_FULL_36_10]|nr:MAG: hypothetical protein A2905_05955 [Candidatus Levybacteria bacterium RIFCSPLOWO2_01_FULL_36_10]
MRFLKLLRKIFSSDKIPLKLLIGWIVLLSILYSLLSVIRHNSFQSGAFDLGLYDQAAWQYANFLYPFNTIKERFILGDHLTLTLPLLSVLYFAWSNVRMLLIFQAVFLALSSIPIYKLIRIRKFSPFAALNLSIVYSLFFGIQFAVFFDFHPVVIGVALLAWTAYFYESEKYKLFFTMLSLLILTQENMGIALAGLGFIYFFKREYRRDSIMFIALGLIISLIQVKAVGLFSPAGYEYFPKINFDPINLIQKYFDSTDKRMVWLYSFSWYSFLPLLSPGAVFAVTLDLSQYFLPAKAYNHMITPFFHHRAILSPLLLVATLDVLDFLKKKGLKPGYVTIFMLLFAFSLQFIYHFPLNKLSKPAYWKNEDWMNDTREILKLVPSEASVAAQQNLVPHLSHRKEIYLVWPRKIDLVSNVCGQKTCWWLEFAGKPQYLVVDVHPGSWVTQLLETPENFKSALNNMQKAGKIKIYKNIGYAYIYKIN